MTKKKTKDTKIPKETGTWYRSLIEGHAKSEFYRHFIVKLNKIITEHFGEDETLRVLKAIDKKRIEIVGIEAFLFDHNDISDPSIVLYNTCKSVEEFVIKSIINFKKRATLGETNIAIKDFFIVLSDLLKTNDLCSDEYIKGILKNFVTSLITTWDRSPYSFILIEPRWAKQVGNQLNLSTLKYSNIIFKLLEIIQELKANTTGVIAYIPPVKVIYPVYYDTRDSQLSYLVSHFRLTDRPEKVINALKEVPDLSKDTPQLRSNLEYLKETTGLQFLSINAVILELKNIGESKQLKRYPLKRTLRDALAISKIPKDCYNKFNINPIFADKETFESCLVPYFCEVQVNCSGLKMSNIETFIDAAKTLNLAKGYHFINKRNMSTLTFKITLLNVEEVTEEFEEFVRNKLKKIKSSTGKNFIIEVFYKESIVKEKIPESDITHFRIISDIHADYNAQHNYHFNFGNDFVINCGDTAGNSLDAGYWVRNYMKKGVLVIGNHMGYASAHPERDGIQNMERFGSLKHPSNTKREQLKELYNLTDKNNVILLSNTCTEYRDIAIIGTCLYTDFNLYGKDHREECMAYAKKYMNDFKLPVVVDNQYYVQYDDYWLPRTRKYTESKMRTFDTSDHAFFFQFSFEFIKEKVEENKHRPIVIVTHHAPSPHSIDEKYKGSLLNAAFASNLNEYIIKHPEIRLWCHGHVHSPHDYILGETRIVCCPFGYNNENNFNLPYEYGLRIPIEDIKSKKLWKRILSNEIKRGFIKVYEE